MSSAAPCLILRQPFPIIDKLSDFEVGILVATEDFGSVLTKRRFMKTLAISFLAAATLFGFVTESQAASMKSPVVQFTFQTKDGRPVEGVSLAGTLRFKALVAKDCSGFICAPTLPQYRLTSDGAVLLGQTNSSGELVVDVHTWRASKFTARDLGVQFFTNGTVTNICPAGTQSDKNFIDLLPQWSNGQAVVRNPECENVEVLEGQDEIVKISCISPLTSAEIESLREQVLKTCK